MNAKTLGSLISLGMKLTWEQRFRRPKYSAPDVAHTYLQQSWINMLERTGPSKEFSLEQLSLFSVGEIKMRARPHIKFCCFGPLGSGNIQKTYPASTAWSFYPILALLPESVRKERPPVAGISVLNMETTSAFKVVLIRTSKKPLQLFYATQNYILFLLKLCCEKLFGQWMSRFPEVAVCTVHLGDTLAKNRVPQIPIGFPQLHFFFRNRSQNSSKPTLNATFESSVGCWEFPLFKPRFGSIKIPTIVENFCKPNYRYRSLYQIQDYIIYQIQFTFQFVIQNQILNFIRQPLSIFVTMITLTREGGLGYLMWRSSYIMRLYFYIPHLNFYNTISFYWTQGWACTVREIFWKCPPIKYGGGFLKINTFS